MAKNLLELLFGDNSRLHYMNATGMFLNCLKKIPILYRIPLLLIVIKYLVVKWLVFALVSLLMY